MYHDYYSLEHFMRDHQRELLADAARSRRARVAAQAVAARGIARPAASESLKRKAARRATVLVFALAGLGHGLVALGRRLEGLAAVDVRPRTAGACKEQPTAAGC